MSETALTTPVNVSGDEGLAVQLPTERFVYGFEGMAEGSFDEKALAILKEPVDPRLVEVKPDGIVYLPWTWYADRLNRAFGQGAWTIVPRKDAQIIGTSVVYFGALFVQKRFIREAAGECEYRANNPNMSYAACYEGAFSDCIVRCCKILGIGKELWDPTWREAWLAEWALKAWQKKRDPSDKPRPYYWRKDRERPWQAEGAATPARNPPKDAPRLAEYVPSPKASTASLPSLTTTQTTVTETPSTSATRTSGSAPQTEGGDRSTSSPDPKGQTLTLLPSASGAESEATAAPSTEPSERVPGEDDDEAPADLVECWRKVEEGHRKAGTYRYEFVPMDPQPRRTNDQNARIHAKKAERGLNDEEWRKSLLETFNKDSSRDLSREEAERLIAMLEKAIARWGSKAATADARDARKASRAAEMAPEMREMLEEGQ